MQQDFVRRAKEGDHDAFASLVRPEIHRLYGLAGLVLHDAARAEDAVQDALLKAWRDLPSLRDVDRFGAWLRRLVVNASYDEGRRLGRRRREVKLQPHHDSIAASDLDGVLYRDELVRGFRHLKPEERTVIALRFYLDLSTADAAATLGIRDVSYRSKLHRAIRSLGAALAADARASAAPGGEVS